MGKKAKTYLVTLTEVINYTMKVEARNEDGAIHKACEIWEKSNDPLVDFNYDSSGVEVKYVSLLSDTSGDKQ